MAVVSSDHADPELSAAGLTSGTGSAASGWDSTCMSARAPVRSPFNWRTKRVLGIAPHQPDRVPSLWKAHQAQAVA
mgnify:CR=1 FL=1